MNFSEQQKQILRNLRLYLIIKILFKIDVSFKNAGRFIDLETFIKDEDDDSFIKETIKQRLPFLKPSKEVIAYAVSMYILESDEVKVNFPWIYNPPSFPNTSEITQGSMERENFSLFYGGYTELVYLCATFENISPKVVFEFDTKYFLFWGEYLLRKKIIENLK